MFLLHLKEIKLRILYIFISFLLTLLINYLYQEELLLLLNKPLITLNIIDHYIYTSVTEAFFSYLKLVIFMSFLLIIPLILINIWLFLIPGLYKQERRKLEAFLIFIIFLLSLAINKGINYFIPNIYEFFIRFNLSNINNINLLFEPKINELITFYIESLTMLVLLMIIPLLLYFINISSNILIKLRKYILIFILIFVGFITPPSIINQLIISVPFIIIYELIIYLKIYKNQ